MRISIVVPTYKRISDLERCLKAIDGLKLQPHQVIIVCRDIDQETQAFLVVWKELKKAYKKETKIVTLPGVIHAMKEGLKLSEGDVTAFIDDDAAPRPEWLQSLARTYSTPDIGGVGGRDVIHNTTTEMLPQKRVGQLTWYGRVIGNHHLGSGEAREVDILKGVNMSFRTHLIEFPDYSKGEGAQVHFEVYLCLRIKKMRFKLIYDPNIIVDHYPAKRFDIDQRNKVVPLAITNASFNQTVALLTCAPTHKVIFRFLYTAMIGDRSTPGLARLALAVLLSEENVMKSYIPALKGQWKAVGFYLKHLFSKSTALKS
ncbi:glycosyltransferase family 2 protein [Paenibacillus sp. 1P07SE]|uniref:glycosyltransferase family 2 protein n=1 Tax=Paenibacillus sp. 1P07SE TaxID=3132209 RepID=UPI0039A716D8